MLCMLLLLATCSFVASQNSIELGISSFAFNFYKESSKNRTGDFVISPLSVASSLALLSQGSNGTTYEQLRKGLYLADNKAIVANQYYGLLGALQRKGSNASLFMANQIYVDKANGIDPNFNKIAQEQYKAGIEPLNFRDADNSARVINDFVKTQTNNKIPTIITPDALNADTAMVLVNAIYFKSNWKNKFDKKNTKKGKFYVNERETVDVDYMNVKARFEIGYWSEVGATVLQMAYTDSQFAFLIILPDNRTGLTEVEKKINYHNIFHFLDYDMLELEVNVTIPKFSIESEFDMQSILKELGMGEMFNPTLDLGGLVKTSDRLRVSKAIHKAVIEINEDGSEASAATALGIENRSGFSGPEHFVVNHPFMYIIRDTEKNTIIFNGRVENLKSKPKTNSSSRMTVSLIFLIGLMVFDIWTYVY